MYNLDLAMDVMDRFHKEARICSQHKCYIASLILYGAVLEAALLCMCFVRASEVRKTETYKRYKDSKGGRGRKRQKRGIFLEFTLSDLIKIAEELDWIPIEERVGDFGIVKDWVKWLQESRNLVHLTRWLKPDPYFGNLHKEMRDFSEEKYKRLAQLSEHTISCVRNILADKLISPFCLRYCGKCTRN